LEFKEIEIKRKINPNDKIQTEYQAEQNEINNIHKQIIEKEEEIEKNNKKVLQTETINDLNQILSCINSLKNIYEEHNKNNNLKSLEKTTEKEYVKIIDKEQTETNYKINYLKANAYKELDKIKTQIQKNNNIKTTTEDKTLLDNIEKIKNNLNNIENILEILLLTYDEKIEPKAEISIKEQEETIENKENQKNIFLLQNYYETKKLFSMLFFSNLENEEQKKQIELFLSKKIDLEKITIYNNNIYLDSLDIIKSSLKDIKEVTIEIENLILSINSYISLFILIDILNPKSNIEDTYIDKINIFVLKKKKELPKNDNFIDNIKNKINTSTKKLKDFINHSVNLFNENDNTTPKKTPNLTKKTVKPKDQPVSSASKTNEIEKSLLSTNASNISDSSKISSITNE
jgi:hypothetical protein